MAISPLLTKTRKITPLPTPRPPRSLQARPFVFAVALGLLFVACADLKHRGVQRSVVRVHHVSDAQAVHLVFDKFSAPCRLVMVLVSPPATCATSVANHLFALLALRRCPASRDVVRLPRVAAPAKAPAKAQAQVEAHRLQVSPVGPHGGRALPPPTRLIVLNFKLCVHATQKHGTPHGPAALSGAAPLAGPAGEQARVVNVAHLFSGGGGSSKRRCSRQIIRLKVGLALLASQGPALEPHRHRRAIPRLGAASLGAAGAVLGSPATRHLLLDPQWP